MSGFAAGVATGILVGVGGTFLILLVVGALTSKRSEGRSELTLFKLGCVTAAILAIFSICHALKIGNGVLIVFLLVAVITTAKLGGVAYGLVASSLAAVGLSWILPPDGSLRDFEHERSVDPCSVPLGHHSCQPASGKENEPSKTSYLLGFLTASRPLLLGQTTDTPQSQNPYPFKASKDSVPGHSSFRMN